MDGGSDKKRCQARRFFPHFICLDGVSGERQMAAMLLHGTEGYEDRFGMLKPLFKLFHGHFFYEHKITCSLPLSRLSSPSPVQKGGEGQVDLPEFLKMYL